MIRNYSVNQARTGPMGEPVQIVLLAPEAVGFRQVFRFLAGEDGGDVSASMMFRVLQSTLADKFDFDINGQVISEKMTSIEMVEDEELPYVWYTLEGVESHLRKGENHLGVTPLKIDTRRLDLEPASLYEPFPYLEELIVTVDPIGSEQKVSQ